MSEYKFLNLMSQYNIDLSTAIKPIRECLGDTFTVSIIRKPSKRHEDIIAISNPEGVEVHIYKNSGWFLQSSLEDVIFKVDLVTVTIE